MLAPPAQPSATLTPGQAVARQTITAYTLAPQQLQKARELHRLGLGLSLGSTAMTLALLLLFLRVKAIPRLLQRSRGMSRHRIVQAALAATAIGLALFFTELPLSAWGHHAALQYGLSVQGWGGWLADRLKAELLELGIGALLAAGLYWLIGRSPRRWWLWSWLASLPLMAALVFAAPVLIDPLFNRYEPLAATQPELTAQLRSLASGAGLEVPASRIFLMHASDKVTTYNAYVTGFGATKRIVVWDTTARDMTLPQVLFVFSHEMGHYVLHHILLGLLFSALLTLIGLWLLDRLTSALLVRCGLRWQIGSLADLTSLPLLLLLASLLSFFGEPVANAFSRWEEHSADVFAMQTMTRTFGDSSQVGAQSFQLLGERSYSLPHPSPLLVFWSYSHPTTAERVNFALSYSTEAK